jgi:hypothetical protein
MLKPGVTDLSNCTDGKNPSSRKAKLNSIIIATLLHPTGVLYSFKVKQWVFIMYFTLVITGFASFNFPFFYLFNISILRLPPNNIAI